MEILQSVCEYGGLSPLQSTILLNYTLRTDPEGRLIADRYCADLMKQLRENDYLTVAERDYHMRDGRKANIHKLTPKSKRALAALRKGKVSGLDCTTVDANLEHFVLVNDFRVTLIRAVADATNGAQILETYDERTLRQRHSLDKMTIKFPPSPRFPQGREEHNVTINPDYYFHLQLEQPRPGHYRRFVEIDRGTETNKSSRDYDDWAKKVVKYREYTKKVGSLCEQRYGKNAVAILTVTTSDTRAQNLKDVTEEAGGKHRFWFTTYNRLTPTSFFTEPIWAIAGRSGLYEFPRRVKDEPK
jgi:hypothetical protein